MVGVEVQQKQQQKGNKHLKKFKKCKTGNKREDNIQKN